MTRFDRLELNVVGSLSASTYVIGKSLLATLLPMPFWALMAAGSLAGAVMSVLAANVMSPVSLV